MEQYKAECYLSTNIAYLSSFEIVFDHEESMKTFMDLAPTSCITKYYKKNNNQWELIDILGDMT